MKTLSVRKTKTGSNTPLVTVDDAKSELSRRLNEAENRALMGGFHATQRRAVLLIRQIAVEIDAAELGREFADQVVRIFELAHTTARLGIPIPVIWYVRMRMPKNNEEVLSCIVSSVDKSASVCLILASWINGGSASTGVRYPMCVETRHQTACRLLAIEQEIELSELSKFRRTYKPNPEYRAMACRVYMEERMIQRNFKVRRAPAPGSTDIAAVVCRKAIELDELNSTLRLRSYGTEENILLSRSQMVAVKPLIALNPLPLKLQVWRTRTNTQEPQKILKALAARYPKLKTFYRPAGVKNAGYAIVPPAE